MLICFCSVLWTREEGTLWENPGDSGQERTAGYHQEDGRTHQVGAFLLVMSSVARSESRFEQVSPPARLISPPSPLLLFRLSTSFTPGLQCLISLPFPLNPLFHVSFCVYVPNLSIRSWIRGKLRILNTFSTVRFWKNSWIIQFYYFMQTNQIRIQICIST